MDETGGEIMIGNLITGMLTAEESTTLGLGMMILLVYGFIMLLGIALYIYSAFALMAIAKKTGTEPAWLAWIPVANMVLISKIAKMHWWPVLMMIPAFMFYMIGLFLFMFGQKIASIVLFSIAGAALLVFGIYSIIWSWKMFEAVQRPGWWSMVSIPFVIIYTVASFSKDSAFQITGSLIYILGVIIYLVLFGIAAWSDSHGSKSAVVTKISDLKNKGKKQ